MGDVDILIDEREKAPILIQGKTYMVGKLSALQVLRLARFMARVATRSMERLNQVKRDGKNPAEDILAIAEIFDEEELAEFTSILLKEDNPQIIADISGEELMDLVAEMAERNDLGKLLGNASRAVEAVKRNLAKASPALSPAKK